MAAIRVLFPFVGDSVGGSHVSSLILARALQGTRYQPVVSVHGDGPLVDYLDDIGITPLRAPPVRYVEGGTLARVLRRVAATGPLARFLTGAGIGIVHSQDMRMHMTWAGAARRAGAAHVWHQRTTARAAKHARAAAQADAVIAVSAFCAASLPSVMAGSAQVVYNPFDVADPPDREAARRAICSALGLPAQARFVVFVANFAARKQPLVFVSVAAALVQAAGLEDVQFLMIGTPREPETSAVRQAVDRAGLSARCHVLGPRHPIEPWLAGADALLAPALDEAFGRTLVEAQLQGTPVVASDAGGHREILRHGETGFLVPPGDVAGFAQAVTHLLHSPDDARRIAAAARRDGEARFSTQAHLRQMLEVYERVSSQ